MRWLLLAAVCAIGCGDDNHSTQDAGPDAGDDAGTCSPQFPIVLPVSTVACAEVRYPGLPSLDAGGNVRSIVAKDLDGDGDIDLALGVRITSAHHLLRVYRGDAAGRFTLATSVDAGTSSSLLAADVNGDAKVDLIVGIQLFVGHGDGTYDTPVDIDTDSTNVATVAADLDGDSKIDLVLASPPRFRKGVGDGTFGTAIAIPDPGVAAIHAVKLDGDADLDLVFANGSTALNNGDGTFAAAVAHSFGAATSSVLVADVDGDTKLDLVGVLSATSIASIQKGNGDGTFAAHVDSLAELPGTVVAADLDNDADLDLVSTNDGAVFISRNPGTGVFPAASKFTSVPFGTVIAADLDGDHFADLVGGTASPGTGLHLVLGSATGFVTRHEDDDPALTVDSGTVAADVNNDGYIDIIRADLDSAASDTRKVGVYFGFSGGSLHPRFEYPVADALRMAITVGKPTPASNVDIFAMYPTQSGSRIATLKGAGDGSFAPASNVGFVPDGAGRGSLALGDLNGDGLPDLVAGTGNGPTSPFLATLANKGDGTWGNAVTYMPPPSMPSYPVAVRLADVDGDCKLDVIALDIGRASVIVYRGNGDGTLGEPTVIAYAPNPGGDLSLAGMEVGDLDKDGDIDIVVGAGAQPTTGVLGKIVVLTNVAGAFTPHDIVNAGQPQGVALGDVDGDSNIDIVVADTGASMVEVLAGHGDGTFAEARRFSTGSVADVLLADLDHDGLADIVTAGEHVSTLTARCQ